MHSQPQKNQRKNIHNKKMHDTMRQIRSQRRNKIEMKMMIALCIVQYIGAITDIDISSDYR